ncbi:MAG: hypothetical protein SWK90_16450, partial [Chloroflexota bacterium]|nr:hypothetical protein [Chloroflexota bacterium]
HHPRRLRRHPPDQHHGASPMTHIPPHTSRLTSLISRFAHHICGHKANIAILALYILIGFVLTLPLPLTMDRCLPGDNIDTWLNPWANWWTQKALSERLPFYHTRYLFYPQGASVVYHSFSHTNTATWLLLRHLIGDLPAHNLTILMTYPLSAFTLYLLAHHLTKSRPAAFIAGFIFAFSPYHVAESSHPILNTVQWIPLFLLSLEKAITQKKVKAGLAAAFWLWLTALSGWHLLVLSLSLGTCRALYLLLTENRWKSRLVLQILLVSSLAFAILTLPFLWPLLREQFTNDTSGYFIAHQERYAGTDLLAFFTPSNYHPLLGPSVNNIYERFYPGLWKSPAFIGYSVLALVCIGAWRGGRQSRFWWITSIILFILALGPRPRVLGQPLFSHPLPWGVPLIRLIRHAGRVNILLTLCWSLLAAWGCLALLRRLKSQRQVYLVTASILILTAFEYCPVPFPSTCVSVPHFYLELAQEPDEFAILEIPLGRQPAKISMYYQTIHGRPLLDGHISRTPPHAYDFIESNELLSLLWQYSVPGHKGPFTLPFPDVSRQLEALAAERINYVVFHRDMISPTLLASWQSFVVVDPVYDDKSLVAYRTRPTLGQDYHVSVRLTEELGLVETDNPLPPIVSQASWLQFDLHWAALETPPCEYHYRVTLRNSTGKAATTYDVELGPAWPTSQWPAGTLFTSHFSNQIDPFLPAGHYQVIVEIINPVTSQAVGQAANLGSIEVQALPRQYVHPQVSTETNVIFGDQIRLIGYDVEQTTTHLNLTFYWQAVRRMDRNYKIFVHLSSLDDGTIVAQYDSMPRDWTYLTSWWDKDEIITDTVVVDTSGLSTGHYKVAVGIYDPDTLERLPVLDHTGTALPEQKLVLPAITVEIQ